MNDHHTNTDGPHSTGSGFDEDSPTKKVRPKDRQARDTEGRPERRSNKVQADPGALSESSRAQKDAKSSLTQRIKNFNLSSSLSACWKSAKEFDWFIGHASSFKENWDFVIMITACWNVFMLPISIAFNSQDKTLETIAAIVDICFVIDMIVVFRTTLLDEESGEEIRDSRIIASSYLRGRFAIDFLSTVPFDQVALVSKMSIFSPTYDFRFSWRNPRPSSSSSLVS